MVVRGRGRQRWSGRAERSPRGTAFGLRRARPSRSLWPSDQPSYTYPSHRELERPAKADRAYMQPFFPCFLEAVGRVQPALQPAPSSGSCAASRATTRRWRRPPCSTVTSLENPALCSHLPHRRHSTSAQHCAHPTSGPLLVSRQARQPAQPATHRTSCLARPAVKLAPSKLVRRRSMTVVAATQNAVDPSVLDQPELTSSELVDLRASQRTYQGAWLRTALANLGYAAVVLKVFDRRFFGSTSPSPVW